MKTNYKIIYEPSCGGLGDGIVGCASAFVLSIILHLDFKIKNGPIKFYNYFDIPQEYISNETSKYIFHYTPNVNNDNIFQNTDLQQFINKTIIIRTGSNFYRFLYKNLFFKDKINIDETSIIQFLFENILIPKKFIMDKLNEFNKKHNLKECICAQIRFGENINGCKDGFYKTPISEKTFNLFVECYKSISDNKKLILVSDDIERAKKLFNNNNIFNIEVIDGIITHSLKSNIQDHQKTLLDLLVIGECKHSIISYWSNYGRIGVLRTKLENNWLIEIFIDKMPNEDYKINWRDNNDPIVINFKKGTLKELLSKDKSYI